MAVGWNICPTGTKFKCLRPEPATLYIYLFYYIFISFRYCYVLLNCFATKQNTKLLIDFIYLFCYWFFLMHSFTYASSWKYVSKSNMSEQSTKKGRLKCHTLTHWPTAEILTTVRSCSTGGFRQHVDALLVTSAQRFKLSNSVAKLLYRWGEQTCTRVCVCEWGSLLPRELAWMGSLCADVIVLSIQAKVLQTLQHGHCGETTHQHNTVSHRSCHRTVCVWRGASADWTCGRRAAPNKWTVLLFSNNHIIKETTEKSLNSSLDYVDKSAASLQNKCWPVGLTHNTSLKKLKGQNIF